jgi:hypothetical protein
MFWSWKILVSFSSSNFIYWWLCPSLNQLAQSYNKKLKSLPQIFQDQDVSMLIFILYGACLLQYIMFILGMLKVLHDYNWLIIHFCFTGFENANYACCHLIGPHGGLLPCGNMSLVCPERTKYVFREPYHLTKTGNLKVCLSGSLSSNWNWKSNCSKTSDAWRLKLQITDEYSTNSEFLNCSHKWREFHNVMLSVCNDCEKECPSVYWIKRNLLSLKLLFSSPKRIIQKRSFFLNSSSYIASQMVFLPANSLSFS